MTTRMKWTVGVAGLALIVAIAAFGFGGGNEDENSSNTGYAEDISEDEDDAAFNASTPAASQMAPAVDTTLSEDIPAEIDADELAAPPGDAEAVTPGEGDAGQIDVVPEYDEMMDPDADNTADPEDNISSEQPADDPTQ